ncbi:hypothetical protein [Streptomyces misionensis]|uniref:hypothetical protein n=1 Tax=Streptomyces misionensis TaxID=67331 RepID=UPI0036FEFA37
MRHQPGQPRRRVTAAIAVLLAAAAAAAVLAGSRPGRAHPAALPLPMPLAWLQLSSAQQTSLDHAEDVLVRRCMRARGLDFAVAPTTVAREFTDPNPYGLLDPAIVTRQGYGLHAATPRSAQESRTPTAAESRALLGTASHAVKMALPGGGYTVENTDGCFSQAQDELYGRAWKVLHYGEETLFARELAQVRQDPDAQKAESSWAACMRASGYRVTALHDVRPDAEQRMAVTGSDRAAGRREFGTLWKQAQRDAACQQKTGVVSAYRRAQGTVESALTRPHRGDLARLTSLRTHALALSGRLAGTDH